MKIPFLYLFKKGSEGMPAAKTAETAPPAAPVKRSSIEKPASDRLSKTVMPNTRRTVSSQSTLETAGSSLTSMTLAQLSGAPRMVSFGPSRKSAATPNRDLPLAVALALEPKVDRAVSLNLLDVVRQMPSGLVKPIESLDSAQRIFLKASELEKRMSEGKPSVSLESIYEQVPEIFLRSVPPTDTTQVSLPFDKVLEAFTQVEVRRDQVRDQAVPHMETPFLKATLEDNERFGIPSEPSQTCTLPPVRLEPATAEAIAAAEPEATASEKFIPGLPAEDQTPDTPLPIPLAQEDEEKEVAAPERIPFQLPPKETGVLASERVPASCGPPVSIRLPPPPEPAPIPFKTAPPSDDLRKKPGAISISRMNEDTGIAERKISFALKPILQSLPVFELSGDPKEVPEDARIEFPFSLIESQLVTGRVAVAPEVFERSLPPDCRRFFSARDLDVPISLSLEEVLKNLPPESLRMRDDQEEREMGETFATPFATQADEDSKRFNKVSAPIAQPAAASENTIPLATPAPDAKSIIAQASQLPGVRACAVSFADGLSLAGNLPPEIGAEGLCAIAPSLLERIETHVLETKIGGLQAMTLHCAQWTVTFLRRADICLAALHSNGELTVNVRDELARMLTELSHTYSQPEVTHVH
ncbi:MAG: roadblock/LC7 domain-containing protein, partial [Verrucomicrobiota bacterium]|nr:roadblock/LC7 domain-containing protein [Verrucomicrobiota bacterium]